MTTGPRDTRASEAALASSRLICPHLRSIIWHQLAGWQANGAPVDPAPSRRHRGGQVKGKLSSSSSPSSWSAIVVEKCVHRAVPPRDPRASRGMRMNATICRNIMICHRAACATKTRALVVSAVVANKRGTAFCIPSHQSRHVRPQGSRTQFKRFQTLARSEMSISFHQSDRADSGSRRSHVKCIAFFSKPRGYAAMTGGPPPASINKRAGAERTLPERCWFRRMGPMTLCEIQNGF